MRLDLKIVFVLWVVLFTSLSYASANTAKTKDQKEPLMDTIHVNGMVLKGKITKLNPTTLSFKLANIEGVNHIPYKDIEAIHTNYRYNIFYDNEKLTGRIVGLIDKDSLQVNTNGATTLVRIDSIDHFSMSREDDRSKKKHVSHTLPYTSGNFHIGFEFESGARVKNKTNVNTNITRKKGRNEGYLHLLYAYESTETPDTPEVTNKDEFSMALGNRYYYDPDNFFFGGLLGEYDLPREIDLRLVPNAGYGYDYKLGKDGVIKPQIGLAYVWTRYLHEDLYPDSSYVAAALGINGKYTFSDVKYIDTLTLDGRYIYYPSLEDFREEWISRANMGLTIPLYEFITMRFDFLWINDSNPAPSIGNNKTQTNFMLGVDF